MSAEFNNLKKIKDYWLEIFDRKIRMKPSGNINAALLQPTVVFSFKISQKNQILFAH